MITKNQQRAIEFYASIMEEMKLRISSIEFATSGLLKFHPVINREFAYLQLRMVCELIALACMTAHGDIDATKSKTLRKAWHADEILKGLEGLHRDFYPHPVVQIRHSDHMQLDAIHSGFLTKQDLVTLNGRCGDIVHRGSMKKLLAGPLQTPSDYRDVIEWLTKIRTLLNVHRIALMGGSHMICVMRGAESGGRAQVAFAEAALPPSGFEFPPVPERPAT